MKADEIKRSVDKLLTLIEVCLKFKGEHVNWDHVQETYNEIKVPLSEHFGINQ